MNKLSIIISVLIAICGYCGGTWLKAIDQDLWVIDSEYALAGTDLGHIYADLIRYRTTILEAIEAGSEQEFRENATVLTVVRARIYAAIERYIHANNATTAGNRPDVRELTELKEVQTRLNAYLRSSDHTVELVNQMWRTSRPEERGRLRREAERYAATVAATKLIDAAIALEDLLTMVAKIAEEVRNDGERQFRVMYNVFIAVSVVLVALVLRPLHRP